MSKKDFTLFQKFCYSFFDVTHISTVKLLNSGYLRVLKNLSVIKWCPLVGGSLTKIVTFGTKHFVRYSRYVHYLGSPLLGGFTERSSSFHSESSLHRDYVVTCLSVAVTFCV